MRIAQFRGTGKYAITLIISREPGDEERPCEGYIRISEWIDVEFPPLAPKALVAAEISQLDAERQEVVTEFAQRLKDIDDRKQELMAITYEASAA
jgi:hypothetical protein